MNMSVRWLAVALVLGASSACFSEHVDSPTGLDDRVPEIECSVPLPDPAEGEYVVGIRDFAFHPSDLTVPPGSTVTWVNCEDSGVASHTTTADGGGWDSGLLGAAGGTFSRTFDGEGSFGYHCTPHPFMEGTVRVEP